MIYVVFTYCTRESVCYNAMMTMMNELMVLYADADTQGRLVTFCADNSLHLWEINVAPTGATVLQQVKSFAMENRSQCRTCVCLSVLHTVMLVNCLNTLSLLLMTSFSQLQWKTLVLSTRLRVKLFSLILITKLVHHLARTKKKKKCKVNHRRVLTYVA